MDLERPTVARDEHRVADRLQVVTDRVDIKAPRAVGLEQEHRLVAEPFVGVGNQHRRLDRSPGRDAAAGAAEWGTAENVKEGALEEAVEPLSAGVDHARFPEDREQARRPRHRLLCGRKRRGQDELDVVVALRCEDRRVGRLADDREDRTLDGLRHRAVGRLRALRQRVGEVEAVEAALAAQPFGHPAEDLAGDDARVAPRTHQRPEADRRRDPLGAPAGHLLCLLERRLDGGEHVRAGIAIRDRVDIEGVDLVDVRLQIPDGRPECGEEPVTIA